MERHTRIGKHRSEVQIQDSSKFLCYGALNTELLYRVPQSAKRILDLGCGTGALGRKLKEQMDREVIGLTYSENEAVLARQALDRVIVCDLNDYDPINLGEFDCIICSHILEHLNEPGKLLRSLRSHLRTEGRLLVALPNTLFWKQRVKFLRGQFRYTAGGLMDSTHFRFFDWNTARELVERAGYKIIERTADGKVPQPFLRGLMPRFATRIDQMACSLMPGFFGWQFVIVATASGKRTAPADE
jgi:SAM-dependent methyltransferase